MFVRGGVGAMEGKERTSFGVFEATSCYQLLPCDLGTPYHIKVCFPASLALALPLFLAAPSAHAAPPVRLPTQPSVAQMQMEVEAARAETPSSRPHVGAHSHLSCSKLEPTRQRGDSICLLQCR
jgi:hypothetical protein